MSNEWGRIDDTGTVYVRTGDGERVIGSWQAGSVEEGLAFYTRRYDDLAADVGLLEGRAKSSAADPTAVAAAAGKLREALATAAVIGDLAALDRRLDGVMAALGERAAAKAAQRAASAARAADAKRALVSEAQALAARSSSMSQGKDWREAGDRFRAIVDEWKAIRGVDRKTDGELWEAFAKARRAFDSGRRAHFAAQEQQRADAAQTKEQLVRDAEKLTDSTDWGTTAKAFRDLMVRWKASGRASREDEAALWARFKAAQDGFFGRRNEHFAKRDGELAANLEAKLALVTEAETLDAAADPDGARKRLRSIHDRWDKVGHVPRERKADVEDRLAAAEQRIRQATTAARTVDVAESPLIIRLRESVGKLQARLERARKAGDDALVEQTEASLATQQEWLAQAESVS
jgi:hypothetical protein